MINPITRVSEVEDSSDDDGNENAMERIQGSQNRTDEIVSSDEDQSPNMMEANENNE